MAVEEGDQAKCPLVPVGDQAKCQACGVKNQVMKRCTRCKVVFYCSRECQVKHWQTHKFLCGPNPQQTIQDHDDGSSVSTRPRSPLPPNARLPASAGRGYFAAKPDAVHGARRTPRGRPLPWHRASRRRCAVGAESGRMGATSRTPTACCATTGDFR